MADADDVRRLALALPDVVEIDSDGFDFRVAGEGFIWSYPERRPGKRRLIRTDIAVLYVGDESEKQALLLGEPGLFFTTRDFASKHPEAIARFAKVVQDAAKYTNTHEAQTLPLFIQLSGMDPRIANQIHHSFTPVSFNAAQIQPVIELAAKYKAIPASFDARELLAQ